jgi:hypothetical protein
MSPKVALERITTLKRVWSTLRPNRSYYGLTLEEFGLRVKPSLDARAELETIDEHRAATAVRRDDSDVASLDLVQRIVNAIKADPNDGEDGEVYAALGYVRKGMRVSGRPRNRPEAGAQLSSESPNVAKEGESNKAAS